MNAWMSALVAAGFADWTGVPCAILEPLRASAPRYRGASVEGEAVAIAAGRWLAGRPAGVLLQNSGLGNAVNPLASLAAPYRIPVLLVVSWRGEPGTDDAAQHRLMGAITLPLLELLGIEAVVLGGDPVEVAARAAAAVAQRRSFAIVVPRAKGPKVRATPANRPPGVARDPERHAGGPTLTRAALIDQVVARFPDRPFVSTTGYMSRALFGSGRRPHHLYMQGSMGFAPALALGLDRPAVVLDGDGALLMRLGTLATVGDAAPEGFVHVVADNGGYASTGGQPAAGVDFAGAALACGYARAMTVDGATGLAAALDAVGRGPTLLHVRIDATEGPDLDRPDLPPPTLAEELRAALQTL